MTLHAQKFANTDNPHQLMNERFAVEMLRYSVRDLLKWIEERTIANTSQAI